MRQEWLMLRVIMCLVPFAFLSVGCEKDKNGSDDASSGANAEADVIYSAGTGKVRGTWTFDLDKGVEAGEKIDFHWNRLSADKTDTYLEPRNGARFKAMGLVDFGAITKSDVVAASLSTAKIHHSALPVNAVVIYKTDEGRYGKFEVRGFSGNEDLTLRWVTWE